MEILSPKQFQAKLSHDPSALLLDVRTPAEFAEFHLKGAHLIDWLDTDLFKKEVATLDKTKTLYIYCRSGKRSHEAATYLQSLGYKVVDMDGGILSWIADGLPVIK